MRRPWPILRLWLAQALLFSIPVIALLAWVIGERREDHLREAHARAAILAESYARELGLLVDDSADLLVAFRALLPLQEMSVEGCPDGDARGLLETSQRYGNLLLVDAAGDVLCAVAGMSGSGVNFADRDWFQRTLRGSGMHVSGRIRGRLTGRDIVVISMAFPGPFGESPRVLALTLDLLTLSETLVRDSLPDAAVVTLVDDERIVLARSLAPQQWIGERVELASYPAEVAPGLVETHAGLDGLVRMYSAARVADMPWTLFVGLPADDVFAAMRADLQRTALVVGVAALLLLLLAIWMSASVGTPVRRLAAGLREVRLNGGGLPPGLQGPREVQEVVEEFNRLVAKQAESLEEVERSERRYRATFEQAPVGIVHQDETGRYVRVNMRFAEMVGRSPEELLGMHDHQLTHPEDRPSSGAIYRRLLAGDVRFGNVQKRYLDTDGREVWTDVVVSRVGEAGEAPLLISVIEDISNSRRESERRALAATVFESSTEGIIITDAARRIRAINGAFVELTGFGEQDMIGQTIEALQTDEHEQDFYESIWSGVRRDAQWRGEIWLPQKAGGKFPALMNLTLVRDERGQLASYVAVFADISHEKRTEAELDYLVHHDALTKLPNRRLLHARLEHTIQQAYRDPQSHFSLLFIDLDDFKVVNDSLGHDAGDQLLIELAQRFSASVRSEDTVARMGGDEFMVLLDGAGTFNEISTVVGKLLAAARQPFQIGPHEVFVSASIGVAIFPLDAEDGATLARNADVAMYRAKDKGKNRFEFYEASMSEHAMERLSLANDLRRALEGGQFYLVYQPKVAASDGRILGFEALLRWRHPERGEISAQRFVKVAEETGLIVPIGVEVLRQATRTMAEWRARGLDSITMAINLSAQEIAHPHIFDRVHEALQSSGLPGAALEIEITESALIRDPRHVAPLLRKLRALGLRIAIDDFGTGYSSLNYLRQFRVDVLKIDQSFVKEIGNSSRARVIPQAVVALGKALQMSTIAEGVETESQASILREMGCDQLQGYGVGRPLPRAEAERMLVARGLLAAPLPNG